MRLEKPADSFSLTSQITLFINRDASILCNGTIVEHYSFACRVMVSSDSVPGFLHVELKRPNCFRISYALVLIIISSVCGFRTLVSPRHHMAQLCLSTLPRTQNICCSTIVWHNFRNKKFLSLSDRLAYQTFK
jgi:hypothetical protein